MTSTSLKTPPKLNSKTTVRSLVWVGSNVGKEVMRGVADHDVAWLFEPFSPVAECLENEFKDSHKAVTVVNAAVYSDTQPRDLSVYNQLNGCSSTLGSPSQFHQDSYPDVDWSLIAKERVRCVRLDDYLPLRVSTLIIDAQGCDFEIIRTVERWLQDGRIDVIRIECDGLEPMHDGLPDNSERGLLAFMDKFDYTRRKIPGKLKCSPDYEWTHANAA